MANSPRVDRQIRRAERGQVGEYAADQTREFKTVAATRAGNDHVAPSGEKIDLKLVVRRDSVQTDLGEIDRSFCKSRNMIAEEAFDDRFVSLMIIRSSRSGSHSGPPCARFSHPNLEIQAFHNMRRRHPIP